jgi:hypothetical protein
MSAMANIFEKARIHKEQFVRDISDFLNITPNTTVYEQLISYISPEASTGAIAGV